ncbi:MAG: mitochondrial fission ELM1 family protein [Gammaproteobacteria bacterium]|nr:MAG: mitochondrial fission ELM1 family protein [Gammaproteobacteria bacterium]
MVWRFTDGKPGHDSQSLGLVRALQARLSLEVFDVPVSRTSVRLGDLVRRRLVAGDLLPDPWLLVGAGHATHVPLLQARRARGGRTVVIMSPGLPRSWYDLCIIPGHDNPPSADNILVTRGSLNTVRRRSTLERRQGMIMIGGPSRHHHWDNHAVADQINRVIRFSPYRHWILTTSRRTPPGLSRLIQQHIHGPNRELEIVSWHDAHGDWVDQQLACSTCAWVTEDSVSMVYEALTSGIPVGLLAVPPRRNSRVVRGLQQLVSEEQVLPFAEWIAGKPLQRPGQDFNEAERAAVLICEQWGPASSDH